MADKENLLVGFLHRGASLERCSPHSYTCGFSSLKMNRSEQFEKVHENTVNYSPFLNR